ncbi:hypothetical protein UlMin_007021 [Ulmus minor]
MARTTLGARFGQSITLNALQSYIVEFISTFFFFFAVVGYIIHVKSCGRCYGQYLAENISAGHVNPAVTFEMTIGGHISVPTALFYWISQMLASHIPTLTIAEQMTGFGASVMEGVGTFVLMYTVYAAGDPRRGVLACIGPLAIGHIAGAFVLATGSFFGGSMNPACAFGTSIVAGNFKNQAAYWVGPLLGATFAVIFYDNVVFPTQVVENSDGGVF